MKFLKILLCAAMISMPVCASEGAQVYTKAEFFLENYENFPLTFLAVGKIKCNYTVNSDKNISGASMLLAAYENGVLKEISCDTKDVTAGTQEQFAASVTVPENYEAYSLKAFLWDEKMSPVEAAVDFPQTQGENFENFSTDKIPSGWRISTDGGTVSIDEENGNKFLHLSDTSAGDASSGKSVVATWGFSDVQIPAQISCRAKFSRIGDYSANINDISYDWIRIGKRESAASSSYKIISAVGAKESADGGMWLCKSPAGELAVTGEGTLLPGSWHDIKIVYTDENKIRFYIDGKFINEAQPYTQSASVNTVSFYTSSFRKSEMYIDDIEIKPYTCFKEDFEAETANITAVPSAGAVETVSDAQERGNSCLMIKDEAGGTAYESSNRVYIESEPIAPPLQVSCKVKYNRGAYKRDESDVSYDWIRFGTGGNKKITITGALAPSEDGTGVRWSARSSDGEQLRTQSEPFKLNTWYYIKMVYTKERKVKYYINGKLAAELEPAVKTDFVNYIELYTSNKRKSEMYIDDVDIRPYEKPYIGERLDYAKHIFDAQNRSILEWLPEMYDAEAGGFYYSQSAKDTERFKADIESTAQAVSYMNTYKIIQYMPENVKTGLINYFQIRQNPDTGYFIDPQNINTTNDRQKARNIANATGALKNLGSAPLYLLPSERVSEQPQTVAAAEASEAVAAAIAVLSDSGTGGIDNLPEYMSSPERYREWIESQDWAGNPWTAGDRLSSTSTFLKTLSADIAEPYWRTALEWLYENQNPDTGVWGGEKTTFAQKASGVFKIVIYLKAMPSSIRGESGWFPNADKYFDTVIENIGSYTPTKIFFPRNILDSVGHLKDQINADKFNENIEEILVNTAETLMLFKEADGGVSAEVGKTSKDTGGGFELSLGLAESDVNASVSYLAATNMFYNLAKLQKTAYPEESAVKFFEKLAMQ